MVCGVSSPQLNLAHGSERRILTTGLPWDSYPTVHVLFSTLTVIINNAAMDTHVQVFM